MADKLATTSHTYTMSAPATADTAADASPTLLHVKTDRFEGPLELLLELVEKRKLLINDISLAAVTNEYVEMVAAMQERSLPHTAQFVALAATLLLLKSKSLLPVLELSTEETERIEDLEATLRYYQIFRDAGLILKDQFGTTILAERSETPPDPVFVPDSYCTTAHLHRSLRDLVHTLPVTKPKPRVQVTPVITLEEMIDTIAKRVARDFKLLFTDLHPPQTERKTVAVGFLAVLELCKQGRVLVSQPHVFADIHIEASRFETPRYE